MVSNYEKHKTFLRDGVPVAIVRYDEPTRHRIIYTLREAVDEDIDDLVSDYETNTTANNIEDTSGYGGVGARVQIADN